MNIIITGASGGIGYELSRQFSLDVNNKVIVIARNRLKLEQLKRECLYQFPGAKIYPLVIDFEDSSFSDFLIPQLLSYFDTIDILINCAGILINKPFDELDNNDMEKIFMVNIISVFKLTKVLLPYLGKNESRSHIVNISSMGGFQGSVKFPGLSAYSSSKAALACFTECLAVELDEKNISVNCLALGSVHTSMFEEAFPGEKANVQPIQMAKFIKDFAISGASFFNGKILPVSLDM